MLLLLSGIRIGYYQFRNPTLSLSSCVSYIHQTPVSLLPMAMIPTSKDAGALEVTKCFPLNNFRVPGLSLKYLIHLKLISVQQKKRARVLTSFDFLGLFVEETVLFCFFVCLFPSPA